MARGVAYAIGNRSHFEQDIILVCVRWNVAYPLSYRHLEELMQKRGVAVEPSIINRWVLKYSPQLEAADGKGPRFIRY
jgi:putative transposase